MIGPRRFLASLVGLFAAATVAQGAPLIAIDPGHGGADSGATGVLPPGTQTGLPPRVDPTTGATLIYEKDINLDVAYRLKGFLEARGYPTVMTRTQDLAGGDVPYTTEGADLKARVAVAEAARAQVFVSLHENALAPTTSGTETFHYYYATEGSRTLATLVHRNMIAALGLPDRGVQSAGFYVLRTTTMPAVLVEGAFLSNPAEATLLADPNTRQRIAEAVGAAIVQYSDGGYLAQYAAAPTVPKKPRYQVNAGSFRRLSDARLRYRFVRSKGFAAVIRSEYNPKIKRYMFVVVGGKFVELKNAKTLRDKMIRKRIRASVGAVAARSRAVRL